MKTLSCKPPKVIRKCIGIFTTLLFCIPLSAQLSGTYFISDTSLFKTFGQAVAALNSQGVSGMVTFEVMPGVYEERIEIGTITGTSESSQVTFRSYYDDSSQVMLTDTCFPDSNYVVFLTENCTWLNFESISFKSRGQTYGKVIQLDAFPQHISFLNCVFTGVVGTPASAGWDIILVHSDASYMDYLRFENNLFEYGSTALYLHGNNNGDGAIQGIIIVNNQFKEIAYQGVLMHNPVFPVISDNIFQCYGDGISIGGCYISAKITNNRIYAEYVGISFNSQSAFAPDALIGNNFIYLGDQANRGISFGGGHGRVNIYHNTIVTMEDYWGNYGIYFGGNTTIPHFRVKNNIIACMNGGSPYYVYESRDIDEMDYNCYYNAGDWFAFVRTVPRVFNLEDFTAHTGFDANSYMAHPYFVSDTNLHAKTAWFDGRGTPLATVLTDIDAEPRHGSFPDVGADEYTPGSSVLETYAGDYTIGAGGNFINLDRAIDSLKLKGVSAPVSLNFLDGEHTLKTRIPFISGSSQENIITLTSESGNAGNVTLLDDNPGNYDNYILLIDGADFLTIRDLGFKANSNSTYGRSVEFKGGSENIKILNNHFQSTFTTNAQNRFTPLYSDENFYRNFEITGNVFDSCAYGMYFAFSKNEWLYPTGIIIDSNRFENVGYSGIFMQRTISPRVNFNIINAGSRGIEINNCEDDIRVTGNKIALDYGKGLYLYGNSGNESKVGLVANNFISVGGSGEARGIDLITSDFLKILHNSVNILSTHPTSGASFYSSSSDHLSIYNNIFKNSGGGYAYYSATSIIDSSDYNDLFAIGSQIASVSGTNYSDLAELQTGTGEEMNSVSVDPVFISDTDLHLNADSVVGLAAPLSEVVTDIDGQGRNPYHPDIGADEMNPSGNYPPIIINPIPDLYLPEDTGIVFVTFLNSVFEDPNPQDKLTFDAISSNPDIIVSINLDSLKVESTAGYTGSAEIVVNASDDLAVARDTFLIAYFDNVNDPPVAVNDTVTVRQDSYIRIFVLENDYDIDGNELRVMSYVEGDHGDVMLAFGSNILVYDPEDDYTGGDSIQYVLSDLRGGYDTAKVLITVTPADMGPFEQILVNFDSIAFGNAIWGDIDLDGDYDIVVCGEKPNGTKVTSVYINNEGNYEKPNWEMEGVNPRNDQAMAFTDINLDGRLDFVITGENNSGNGATNIYISEYGLYSKRKAGLPDVHEGSVDWGDFDNDGDPDLLISGQGNDGINICEIYRFDRDEVEFNNWTFVAAGTNFLPLKESTARFVDFNQDGLLDVISTGVNDNNEIVGYYYTNTESGYIIGTMDGHYNGSIDYCDYNADGIIEILTTGSTSPLGGNPVSRFVNYEQDDFVELESSFENVFNSSADWGDYDKDGDYDLILCGKNDQLANITVLYENRDDTLVNSEIHFPGMAQGTVNWGDYDNDGDLDILFSGYFSSSPNYRTGIYKNNAAELNQPPSAPEGINISGDEKRISISWEESQDNESPAQTLTYNVWLKRKKAYRPLIRPLANDSGILKTSQYGNSFNNSILLGNLEEGALYTCKVQAIDPGFNASGWSEEFDFNAPSDVFLEKDFTIKSEFTIDAEWIDYDNNDNLELLISGVDQDVAFTRIYPVIDQELDTAYSDLNHTYFSKKIKTLDFNNDNLIDISYGVSYDSLISISITGGEDVSWHAGIVKGSFDWGDYENDGDEDLVISGLVDNDTYISKLFRNNNGAMENYNILITGAIEGDIEWVDYDNDGDLDIALSGYTIGQSATDLIPVTKIYNNRNNAFIDTEMDLIGLGWSSMDFADYDNDGDVDLLICGLDSEIERRTLIYQNQNNIFYITSYTLASLMGGECKWIDINNDGYLDIILTGHDENYIFSGQHISKIYLWESNSYTEVMTMGGIAGSRIAAGDYNNDNKVDLFIAGRYTNINSKGILYENITETANQLPVPPVVEKIYAYGDSAKIVWGKGFDNETRFSGMTYNLRIGSLPGGSDILSAKAGESGFRKVVEKGNMGLRHSFTVPNLIPGMDYYYAIQSIDKAYQGSEFSRESVFNSTSGFLHKEDVLFDDWYYGHSEWIDYDNDNDLDLLVLAAYGSGKIGIHENEGSSLDTSLIPITDMSCFGKLQINDFNGDNDLDFSLSECPDGNTSIHQNSNGTYIPYDFKIPDLRGGMSAWADMNNDGLEDYITMGYLSGESSLYTYIYRHRNGEFELLDNLMQPMWGGTLEFTDMDSDGDLDLFTSGYTRKINPEYLDNRVKLYMNDRGGFAGIDLPFLTPLEKSDVDFGDLDNDGDPDMLYSGFSSTNSNTTTYLCENNGGNFAVIDSFRRAAYGKVKWADLNNDGLMDFVLAGTDNGFISEEYDSLKFAYVYLNDGNKFSKIAELESFHNPTIAIGDYNNDRRLDLFIGGGRYSEPQAFLYQNLIPKDNTPPLGVTSITATPYANRIQFDWDYTGDGETPAGGLTYNMRIGTTPGGNEILAPLSHANGFRKVVRPGNTSQSTSYTIWNIDPGTTYYYSIQAIDNGFLASGWSMEKTISTLPTGIMHQENRADLIIYPNPSDDLFNLKLILRNEAKIKISVINQIGQIVHSKQMHGVSGINENTLSVPGQGIYTLQILIGNEVFTRRIIKL